MKVVPAEDDGEFVFARKPKPVPGDLRIAWRMGVTLLALFYSRGQKASFAKLHMLNDALRSDSAGAKLLEIVEGKTPQLFWQMRVEPAFSRNLDFMVGESFAVWTIASDRTGLMLTPRGKRAAEAIDNDTEVLIAERAFLKLISKKITETFVQEVISAGKRLL